MTQPATELEPVPAAARRAGGAGLRSDETGHARSPFRSTITEVEIHASARKHGVADEDVLHAIDHALAIEDAGEDPDRWLVIGPDRAGNLQVVVLTTLQDSPLAIHAMPMRARFRRLLDG